MRLPNVDHVEQYIRDAAVARGIDPDIAVRVAKSEGLGEGIWQSNFRKRGVREPSYGPFQLLVGGNGTGYPVGMGNAFQKETGLDPSDPQNVYKSIDYALDQAAKRGWGEWYGAGDAGIGLRDGLSGARPIGVKGREGQKPSPELSGFMDDTEADASFSNLMAGDPGIPESPSALEVFGLLNETNTRPRQSPSPVMAKPENPANPSYSDNAVGPLAQRDYGYDLPKTTGDLIAALGGPAPKSISVNATPGPVAMSSPSASASLDLSEVPSISGGRAETPVADLAYGPSQRLGPRGTSSVPDVPPSRFDTAFNHFDAPEVPQSRFDIAFSPFDAPEATATTTTGLPKTPGVQFMERAPLEVPSASSVANVDVTQAVPEYTAPTRKAQDKIEAPEAGVLEVPGTTTLEKSAKGDKKKKGSGTGAVIGAVAGALAGGIPGAIVGGRMGYKHGNKLSGLIPNLQGINVGDFGGLVTREGFERTPLGQATQAAWAGGDFDNKTFTREYAERGGNWDNVAAAQEQRERSLAGQKTIGDAFGGLFR